MQEIEKEQISIIEEYELPEESSQEDLAVAETILANLLVRQWLASHITEQLP